MTFLTLKMTWHKKYLKNIINIRSLVDKLLKIPIYEYYYKRKSQNNKRKNPENNYRKLH